MGALQRAETVGDNPRCNRGAAPTRLTDLEGQCSIRPSLVEVRPGAREAAGPWFARTRNGAERHLRGAKGAMHGNARERYRSQPASIPRSGRCGNRRRRGGGDPGDGGRPEGPHLPEERAQHPGMGELCPGLGRRVQAAGGGIWEGGRGRCHRRSHQHERPQPPNRLGHRDQGRSRHHHDDLQLAPPLRRRSGRRGRPGRGDRQPGRRLLRAQQEGQRRRQPLEGSPALLRALHLGVPRGLVRRGRAPRSFPRPGTSGARSESPSRTSPWARPSATAWAIRTTGFTR